MAAGYLETALDQHIAGPDPAPPSSSLEIIVLIQNSTYDTGNIRMVSKLTNNTTEREWRFVFSSAGFRIDISTDGSNFTNVDSTTDHPVANGDPLWARVVHNLSAGEVDFYYSEDPIDTLHNAVSWTQVGATVTGVPTAYSDQPSLIRVGGENTGDPIDRTYGAWIYYDGSLVASPDARDDDQGWSSPPATDDQANSWSLVNGATWVEPTIEERHVGRHVHYDFASKQVVVESGV